MKIKKAWDYGFGARPRLGGGREEFVNVKVKVKVNGNLGVRKLG
jgi:hypothetical protein